MYGLEFVIAKIRKQVIKEENSGVTAASLIGVLNPEIINKDYK